MSTTENTKTPSLGRVVLVRMNSEGGEEFSASISRVVTKSRLNLFVLVDRDGDFSRGEFHKDVPYYDPEGGPFTSEEFITWRWPPYVP